MRNLLVLTLLASACAARPSTPTMPVAYTCGSSDLVREGSQLVVKDASRDPLGHAKLGWVDDQGAHFVTADVELIISSDPHVDAIRREYDTSKGMGRSDWRITGEQVCTARGGYTDVLTRFARGKSIDEVASELELDRSQTRALVDTALRSLRRRYFADR